MHFAKAFSVLMVTASATAWEHHLKIEFARFAEPGCTEGSHIAKDTHLKSGHCKTFDHHEPGFHSFVANAYHHKEVAEDNDCRIIAYEEIECNGNGTTMSDLSSSFGDCEGYNGYGRSVRITCSDRGRMGASTVVVEHEPEDGNDSSSTSTRPRVTRTVTVDNTPEETTLTREVRTLVVDHTPEAELKPEGHTVTVQRRPETTQSPEIYTFTLEPKVAAARAHTCEC